jgi:1-deoxy-D-xylulose-5-phosphate reductoisomerase
MKRIAILGSTGSIGVNTLNVARHLGESVVVEALAAHSNIDLIERQAREFNPRLVALYDVEKARELQRRLPHLEVVGGMEGLCAAAALSSVDLVVSAIAGTLGLVPTIAALEASKDLALANKEALVSGGSLVMGLARQKGVALLPVDSEHSAIFQALVGEDVSEVSRLILTASGGPFLHYSVEQLAAVTPAQALAHPTWKMGPKITVDSSTLMNKGLEVIEAYWLFGIPLERMEVVVHPQSIVHSMVEFVDGSMIAQMSMPSMVVPIQYAITYPKRCRSFHAPFDFTKSHSLQFMAPDRSKFRCLQLAFDAVKAGGSMAGYMNAANEVLVDQFVQGRISWHSIAENLESLMARHSCQQVDSLEAILAVDALARREALAWALNFA